MTPQSPSLLSSLPAWARQLSESYYSGAFTLFVIHGNVRDLVTLKRDTAPEFLSLHAFLQQVLFGQRDLVLTYDRGGGLSFAHPDMQADFQRAFTGYDSLHGSNYSQGLPRYLVDVLNLMTIYLD